MDEDDIVEVCRPSRRFRWRIQGLRYTVKKHLTDAALALVVWLNRDSGYLQHLRREVPHWFGDKGPNRWMAEGTEQLLAVFSHHGHSGSSAAFGVEFFATMARFKPWGPLTGADDEWHEVSEGIYQNRRCSHVFKENGEAYDIDGIVFHDGDHIYYTNYKSRVPVTFPYTPPEKPQIVDTTA